MSSCLYLCNCFTEPLIIKSVLSPHSRTRFNLSYQEERELVQVCVSVCVCLHVRSAAVKSKDGESGGRGDHNGEGARFICTQKWCVCVCVSPGPPSLILYQLTPTPRPYTHTHTHKSVEEDANSHLTLLSFFFFFFFRLCCHKIYCILWAERFLNYRFEVSLVTNEAR